MEGRRAFADTYRGGCRAFAGITDSDTDDTPPDANQQTLGQVSAGPFVRPYSGLARSPRNTQNKLFFDAAGHSIHDFHV